jgi:hypothetical protein
MLDPKLRIILDNLIDDTYVHFIWRKRLKTRMKINFLSFKDKWYLFSFIFIFFPKPILSQERN